MNKKKIRHGFRATVFDRDRHKCRVCDKIDSQLDSHHITDRNCLPYGGYVKENGISLCHGCHAKAEVFHATGVALENFAPRDLYQLIGSSYEKAYEASLKLGGGQPLYYEAHITIEPVFDEKLEAFKDICNKFNFRVAELLLKKRHGDTTERSQYDSFCTGRSQSYDELRNKMHDLVEMLKLNQFKVWRYKLEATISDVRIK